MRRISLLVIVGLAVAVFGCAGPTKVARAAEAESALAERLDRLIARERPLARASVGMLVVRASDGEVVYARGADRMLVPASNQKILTALASLSRFGPSHHFTTRIWANARPDADGIVDSLLVEGGGDPATNSEDWWRLASNLRHEGLRGVRGDLRVDDSHFDGPGWHPSWGRISARAYHAPVGALTANYGGFRVAVGPAKNVGLPAEVSVDPPVEYLRVRNRATTAKKGTRARLSVDRAPGREREGPADEVVVVDGIARVGDEIDTIYRSITDPGLYAGALFAYQLEANEIFVDGDVRRAPLAKEEGWVLLHEHDSGRRLAEIVSLCMKYSNNSIAEALLKNLGAWDGVDAAAAPARQGDWPGGVRALRAEQAPGPGGTRRGVPEGPGVAVPGGDRLWALRGGSTGLCPCIGDAPEPKEGQRPSEAGLQVATAEDHGPFPCGKSEGVGLGLPRCFGQLHHGGVVLRIAIGRSGERGETRRWICR